jgi:hypothetical protein
MAIDLSDQRNLLRTALVEDGGLTYQQVYVQDDDGTPRVLVSLATHSGELLGAPLPQEIAARGFSLQAEDGRISLADGTWGA